MMRLCLNHCLGAAILAIALMARPSAADAMVTKSMLLENNVAYLRIAETGKGLSDDVLSALNGLEATNGIAGIVVDLRFAKGTNDAGLAPTEQLLEQKKVPLAILMNTQTAPAAARLGEDLREANSGLVFGASPDSFQPDIPISISTNAEISFLKNPYAVPTESNSTAGANTNLLPFVEIDHTTEADLVREKIKDGEETIPDRTEPDHASSLPRHIIRDPVLAHGVDFIKGLAILHLSRS